MQHDKIILTYFDGNFYDRGAILLRSLLKNLEVSAQIIVYALDEQCADLIKNEFGDNIIVRNHFKPNANLPILADYFYALSAKVIYETANTLRHGDELLYVDADIKFYGCPGQVFAELQDYDIAVSEHRLPWFNSHHNKYGRYNVGVNVFKVNDRSLAFIKDWLDYCENPQKSGSYEKVGFFSDQIFWDRLPGYEIAFKVIANSGINTAPWNLFTNTLNRQTGTFYAASDRLICYHFSSIAWLGGDFWVMSKAGNIFFGNADVRDLYRDYIKDLKKPVTGNVQLTGLKTGVKLFLSFITRQIIRVANDH